jgi:hypothetical protein
VEALTAYHERREVALGRLVPSLFLQSLRAYAGSIVALEMYEELNKIARSSDLQQLIQKNRKRVSYLNRRAAVLQKNEPTWKPATRKKNTKKLIAWLKEAEELNAEVEDAVQELQDLEASYG